MSVVVKGMKMPENCIACPMQFGGWCYAALPEIDERVAPTVDEAVEQGKPDWCPLVDLGKHGDLIDADYFKEHLITCAENGRPLHRMYTELSELIEAIDNVPTIVEAEDEHDNRRL